MNKLFALFLGFTCFIALDATAQVYKCADQNGKVSYVETPCTANGKSTTSILNAKEAPESERLEAKKRLDAEQAHMKQYDQARKKEEARESQMRANQEMNEKRAKAVIDPPPVWNHFDNVREIVRQQEMSRHPY